MAQEQAKENPAPKIVFVDKSLFADEKEGILILLKILGQLDAEFQPAIKELEAIAERINRIGKEIQSVHNCPDPRLISEKQSEIERLIRELKYKHEQAKASYQKRYDEAVKPIEEDIEKELKAFVKEKGYDDFINLSGESVKVECSPCQPDITKEFIAYYNAKHPLPL